MPDAPAPNPHALPAAAAVSARHAAAIGDARWPMALRRIAPGLTIAGAPRVPRYDINGGPIDAAGMREALAASGRKVVVANAIAAEGPIWAALQALAAEGRISLAPIVRWERSLLDRAAAPDAQAYLDALLSGSQRKSLRRKRRALEEMGALKLAVAETPDAVAAAFDVFCALEAAGWKGRDGTALAQDPEGLAYVREVMLAMAAETSAFVITLQLAGRAIAAGLFLRASGEAVFWKTTYDETLAKHSPGVIFDLMLTEWFYAQPWFERLDAGHDDSVDPAGLIWKQRRRMANVVIDLAPGSPKGRLVVAALRLRQRLRAWRNRRWA
jgi:CelD/BcsL family acetyltransferase involved in cellulose biosynthesis